MSSLVRYSRPSQSERPPLRIVEVTDRLNGLVSTICSPTHRLLGHAVNERVAEILMP